MILKLNFTFDTLLVYKQKLGRSEFIRAFKFPSSIEEFKLWFDITNQQPTAIVIGIGDFTYPISRRDFESLSDDLLEVFELLFIGQVFIATDILYNKINPS